MEAGLGSAGCNECPQPQLRQQRLSFDPPARLVVLSIDYRSRILALDRRSASLLDVHFTPIWTSWFDEVEGLFAKLTG
jgi:hypothetical protein